MQLINYSIVRNGVIIISSNLERKGSFLFSLTIFFNHFPLPSLSLSIRKLINSVNHPQSTYGL